MGMFSRNPLLAEVYLDSRAEFRFRIKSRNGEIVLDSEGYTRKLSAIKTLQMLQKNGLAMTIEDLT